MSNLQTEGSTSSSLLARVRKRDPVAWGRLTDLYGPKVYRWVRTAGLQSSDAADVCQEVFRAVDAGLDAFRRDRPGDSFRGWLWGITRNKLKEHYRQAARQAAASGGTDAQGRLAELPELLPAEDDQFEHAEVVQRALQLLQGEFEEKSIVCFTRMVLRDEPASGIAADLGMTAKAVRQAKFRVMRRLRQELDGLL